MEVKKTTVEKVRELAQPIADELGFFLWDVRFEKEGATWYLRVLIDKDGGIDMDDCEAFTRPMNKVLDEADPISQSYVLECGSPGLGRELRRPEHFELWIEFSYGSYRGQALIFSLAPEKACFAVGDKLDQIKSQEKN